MGCCTATTQLIFSFIEARACLQIIPTRFYAVCTVLPHNAVYQLAEQRAGAQPCDGLSFGMVSLLYGLHRTAHPQTTHTRARTHNHNHTQSHNHNHAITHTTHKRNHTHRDSQAHADTHTHVHTTHTGQRALRERLCTNRGRPAARPREAVLSGALACLRALLGCACCSTKTDRQTNRRPST